MMKVAAYCRVSTDHADQANSFEAQKRYFADYIQRNPDWELYEIYADEGLSGTSTEKRVEFNRMMDDAFARKFQMIITKETSRFSRNVLDTLTFTRELRKLGISVRFLNDGVDTLDASAENRLTFIASNAQDESQRTSKRVQWGQQRSMEHGNVMGHSLLGYQVKDKQIAAIDPEGAEIVRLIFYKYGVEKKGTSVIARELREAGYRTATENPKWSNSYIVKVLKNEKYVGDLVQQKTFTPDYLTHKKKYNHGEVPLISHTDHHAAIIDRALWDTVQEELQKRNRHGEAGGHSNRYVLSGKIKCGECGTSFSSRKKTRCDGSIRRTWRCRRANDEGKRHTDCQGNELGCDVGRTLSEDAAMDMIQQGLQSLQMDQKGLIDSVAKIAVQVIQANSSSPTTESLRQKIDKILRKKEKALDSYLSEAISESDMKQMNHRYNQELEVLQERLEAIQEQGKEQPADAQSLDERIHTLLEDTLSGEHFSEVFYKSLLDHLTVYQDGKIELFFQYLPHKWTFQAS